jgi:hypothetical protein
MDWDYSFYIPKNNAFSKQWSIPDKERENVLIITEANRCRPCTSCNEPVGEVATTFYEIDRRCYCLDCGKKILSEKNKKENSNTDEKQLLKTQ